VVFFSFSVTSIKADDMTRMMPSRRSSLEHVDVTRAGKVHALGITSSLIPASPTVLMCLLVIIWKPNPRPCSTLRHVMHRIRLEIRSHQAKTGNLVQREIVNDNAEETCPGGMRYKFVSRVDFNATGTIDSRERPHPTKLGTRERMPWCLTASEESSVLRHAPRP
jgi:hypothetical protein